MNLLYEVWGRLDRRLAVAAAVLAVLVGFLLWLLVLRDRDGAEEAQARAVSPRGPEAVTVGELRRAAVEIGHAVYWAGTQPDVTYELTVAESGNVFIRYLEGESNVGGDREALSVGTYPARNAYGALEASAGNPGAITHQNDDGSLVVTSR
jgi:hypothetical protein